jgi:hypothetical protein
LKILPNGRSRDSFSTGYTANKQVFPKVNKGPTYLGARDTQEADRHEHTSNRHLVVAKLDSVEILHAETVRRDEAVERKNLVHLNRSNESAATLSDNVRDYKMSAARLQGSISTKLTRRYMGQL